MSIERPESSTPRAGTVVWGVILVLAGLAVTALGVGVEVDLQAVLIVLLVIAGVGLLVKALLPRPARPAGPADDAGWSAPTP